MTPQRNRRSPIDQTYFSEAALENARNEVRELAQRSADRRVAIQAIHKRVISSKCDSIVTAIEQKHHLSPGEIFTQYRISSLVNARAEAFRELHKIGVTKSQIAHYFNMSRATVDYYLNGKRMV